MQPLSSTFVYEAKTSIDRRRTLPCCRRPVLLSNMTLYVGGLLVLVWRCGSNNCVLGDVLIWMNCSRVGWLRPWRSHAQFYLSVSLCTTSNGRTWSVHSQQVPVMQVFISRSSIGDNLVVQESVCSHPMWCNVSYTLIAFISMDTWSDLEENNFYNIIIFWVLFA